MAETWVHHFQPETKQQRSQDWDVRWQGDDLYFLDAEGVLLVDYQDKGHTITAIYYAIF